MQGANMNIDNGVIEVQNQERKVSIESNNMETSEVVLGDQSHNQEDGISNDGDIMTTNEVVPGDQSQVSEVPNNENPSQDPANASEIRVVRARPSTGEQPRFQRRRLMPQENNNEPQMQAENVSMIQSLVSQPSQPVSSQLEGCRNCSEYKVEIKRLRQTIIRITRDAAESKKRMDSNISISLNSQEAMQKEVRLLRRNSEKLHIEITSLKGLLREIQSVIGRYKF